MAALALVAAQAQAAQAATISVNTTNDELNSDGDCALREAVQAANDDVEVDACAGGYGGDVIGLPAGTYALTSDFGYLKVTDDVTMSGAGAATTVVGWFELYDQSGQHPTVEISGLTIRGRGIINFGTLTLESVTLRDNFGMFGAAAIQNENGMVTINDSTVANNATPENTYGPLLNLGGTLIINRSTISGNSGGIGGAIANKGTLLLTDSTVSYNEATGQEGGGGVYNDGQNSTATITRTTIVGNEASNGGGVYAFAGAMTLNDSTVSGNRAIAPPGVLVDKGEGAGLWVQKGASADVTDSTISENTSDTNGGGIWSAGVADISDSTISSNFAANGGGTHNHGGSLDLANTTVSGNSATQGGGILDHDVAGGPGGGTTLESSTIAQNAATSSGGGLLNLQVGGSFGTIAAQDAIVADNSVGASQSDCTGPLVSQGHNLIGTTSGCSISGDTSGNITGQDAKLGLLAQNGGPTKTHMPALTSPALDGASSACPAADQRGTPRPQGAGCDIGALERDPLVDLDADHDGCADDRETDTNAAQGGLRDPSNFWDFMDVPTGTGFARDKRVSGGDIAAVVARFGSNDATPGQFNKQSDPLSTPNATILPPGARANYHPAYDRGGTIPGGDPWDLKAPNGGIDGGDISAVVVQFGHNCL